VVVNVYPSMMKTGANKELWPSDKDPVAHVQGAGFLVVSVHVCRNIPRKRSSPSPPRSVYSSIPACANDMEEQPNPEIGRSIFVSSA
jgi:hypothetical protein